MNVMLFFKICCSQGDGPIFVLHRSIDSKSLKLKQQWITCLSLCRHFTYPSSEFRHIIVLDLSKAFFKGYFSVCSFIFFCQSICIKQLVHLIIISLRKIEQFSIKNETV